MASRNWHEEVHLLLEGAKDALERSSRTTSRNSAEYHQRTAIMLLMEAVELHNDNFRFKVTSNGKKLS